MIYKQFQGLKLSALGLGAMRLPVMGGRGSPINEEEAESIIDAAMKHGINYYDTAWGYHEGNSEIFLGKILSKYPRDSFYLATKFPGFEAENLEKVEEIFEEQLKKCRVEYFDFYLLHNVSESSIENYLDERYNLFPYLLEQKKKGRIRHLGFSAHCSAENMRRFLDKWGEHLEFCQIQLNYIDWSLQKASDKVALLNERNIPIWVMEPLRGGKLATLSEEDSVKLKSLRPDEGIPAWGFRYLQTIPGVTMILSGMSNMEQIMDNLHTFETERPLNGKELAVLEELSAKLRGGVPCTACGYCIKNCPQKLDIPGLFEIYNELSFASDNFPTKKRLARLSAEERPDACIGCRSCEPACPQQIKIPDTLADLTAKGKALGLL